jgi:hypothetical protein
MEVNRIRFFMTFLLRGIGEQLLACDMYEAVFPTSRARRRLDEEHAYVRRAKDGSVPRHLRGAGDARHYVHGPARQSKHVSLVSLVFFTGNACVGIRRSRLAAVAGASRIRRAR